MDYKKLGKRIREERHKLHLTQEQLAEAVNISTTYMGAIERGERNLSLGVLIRIINCLGVSIDYLFNDTIISNDSTFINQFREMIYNRSLKQKQMAISILRTIFSYMDE